MTTAAVTGHRPSHLGPGGYSQATAGRLLRLAMDVLREFQPDTVITGMALGWDTAIAQACVLLQIPFDAYVPCEGHESVWPEASQKVYRELLTKARTVKIVTGGGYEAWKMHSRNVAMVDRLTGPTDFLLALWDEQHQSGGTYKCVQYAERAKVQVYNVWPVWVERYAGTR